MPSKEVDTQGEKENITDGEEASENSQEVKKDEKPADVSVEVSSEKLPPSRDDEIKNVGIIQHLRRVGENLQSIYEADLETYPQEQKDAVYQKYLEILREDTRMIYEQKAGYEEELPPNVLNVTKPIDDNMIKVMDQCLFVVNSYIDFINEEDKDLDFISNSFEVLEDTAYILDETEDMLREVFESVETTGGIIGEA